MATLPAHDDSFKMSDEELAIYNAACPRTGNYYARIFKFVHIGTKEDTYLGKPTKTNKFKMYFELMSAKWFTFDKDKGPQPWTCNVESAYSTADKSNLLKYIKNIYNHDPKIVEIVTNGSFQISNLMNKLVMVETVQTMSKKGKANIKVTNVSSPMEVEGLDLTEFKTRKLHNEIVIFDIDGFLKKDPQDLEAFKKLYKFERKMISETEEFVKSGLRLEDFETTSKAPDQYSYKAEQGSYAQQGNAPYPQDPGDDDVL